MSTVHKVRVGARVVTTTVVKTKFELDQSLRDLLSAISSSNNGISGIKHVVGLDIEKRFCGDFVNVISEKVAIVKLCFGTNCLIIQLTEEPPCSLSEFLQTQELSFVGVGIKHCLDALSRDYGVKCRNAVDLGELAATVRKSELYRHFGLLELANNMCSFDLNKDLLCYRGGETLGCWGADTLSQQQIEAATLGAFLCFYVGNYLFGGYLLESDDDHSSRYYDY